MQKDSQQFNAPGYTVYAHGAAIMIRKEVLYKPGGFPEEYFLYYEELDLSEKVRKSGYFIRYQPEAVIFHKDSATVGRYSAAKHYYLYRNRIRFLHRNSPMVYYVLFLTHMGMVIFPIKTIKYFLSGRSNQVRILFNAIFRKEIPEIIN